MLTLRETAEGLIEIIETRPTVLGVFERRDVAEGFMAWYQAQSEEPPKPASRRAKAAARALPPPRSEAATPVAPPRRAEKAAPDGGIMSELPMVVSQPAPPARRPSNPPLNDRERTEALDRLTAGETLMTVSKSMGLPWTQLRSVWATHKQRLQRYLAEGGSEECSVCARPFIPSVSQPQTCARCSRD